MDNKSKMNSELAKAITALCVRNTYLEELHSGRVPDSETGDYSDVKVVTPYGEIPWNELSRLKNSEMKILMKEITDKIFTFLENNNNPEFAKNFLELGSRYSYEWDNPEIDKGLDKLKKEKD